MAATLKEIALAARVSVATVSRALNDRPGVGARMRRRIRAIAGGLGYSPHANALALVTGRVPFLGLVVPDITNPFFPLLARGAEEEAFAHGYSLLLMNTNWRPDRLRHALDLVTSRRVAGLMLSVASDGPFAEVAGSGSLARQVVMAGVPAPEGSGIVTVEVDDHEGGRLVGRHLVESGWKRIAFVGGVGDEPSTRDRLAGLKAGLAEMGRKNSLIKTSSGDWSEESGRAQAVELLGLRQRPDAIFAANDLLALGVASAVAEAGLRLGDDIGLAGYDDIDAVRRTPVPITSVAQPVVEIGRQAARMLVALVEGVPAEPCPRLEPFLVARRSTGANFMMIELAGMTARTGDCGTAGSPMDPVT
jgi:LacI family transcriptional regulator